MAKVTYTERFGTTDLSEKYSLPLDREPGSTAKQVDYVDTTSGYGLHMEGTGFTYGGSFDGDVDKLVFLNSQGKVLLTVTNANVDGSDLVDAGVSDGFQGMLDYVLRGKDDITGTQIGEQMYAGAGADTVKGLGGNDSIDGGAGNDKIDGGAGKDTISAGIGNDRLTGGTGSDIFFFTGVTGKDVITDFDALGGGNKQDYLQLDNDDFTKKSINHGHDTFLQFSDGDTLTLLDVKAKDFTAADYQLIP